MTFVPHGLHLIAGQRVKSASCFTSDPAEGPGLLICEGTAAEVDAAARAAEDAFAGFGWAPRTVRADLLDRIADAIEARAADITAIGTRETGLPAARLDGERGRTTGQLRLFARHIRDGAYLDRRHDPALPGRTPPRPDIRMMQRPIGPVAVFGASNFPLAFSTAGGDTAAALAAGCPVIVKGHPAHPGTAEIVAEAITEAVAAAGLHPGVFSLVQGSTREVGAALVQHPAIRAVGFTGSLGAGRALFDLCARRPEPIPFFGELGSTNPVFVLPAALAARGEAIAQGWAASLTLGAGQFCTNPGIVVLPAGDAGDRFLAAVGKALETAAPQTMLTAGIAASFRAGRDRIAATAGVRAVLTSVCDRRNATPYVFEATVADWLANHDLGEEVFGPLGLVVRSRGEAEMLAFAESLMGQLTATLQLDSGDMALARRLLPILERKAGRVLANGFPTGVEVCDAMVHGGPYPATTNFGATSVGTLSIRRFLRPVSYQNLPLPLLPDDLHDI